MPHANIQMKPGQKHCPPLSRMQETANRLSHGHHVPMNCHSRRCLLSLEQKEAASIVSEAVVVKCMWLPILTMMAREVSAGPANRVVHAPLFLMWRASSG